MKTYNTPMLQVVSINKNDIIATSNLGKGNRNWNTGDPVLAPDRTIFDPDDAWSTAGY